MMTPIDDSDRLKPCPYCGADAEIGEEQDGGHFVQCLNSACGASSALLFPLMDDVKPLLLERWNNRCDIGGDERRHVVCVCPDCACGPRAAATVPTCDDCPVRFPERGMDTEEWQELFRLRARARTMELALLAKNEAETLALKAAQEADELRATLRELVAMADMKTRLQGLHDMGHGTDWDGYHERNREAWVAARIAALGA